MKLAKNGMLGFIMALAIAAAGCGMGDAADDGTVRYNDADEDYVNSVTNGTDDRNRVGDDDNVVEDAVDGARDIGDDVVDGAREIGDEVMDGAEEIGDGAADAVDDAVRDRGAGADNSAGTGGANGTAAGANGSAGANGTAD